ncbi:B-4DMT family transporter [Actinosynnema sp. NPDC047251]|uniref:Putative membrane protein n=1 Tax=Saccharothrix espanaensis (strain ATCC 51144 / DSM 44229 / JCM 9112 / NBRC 15066 / NRRL 15764) TaxID=1179773 RepID=K0K9U5_SACES|nr:B-4DMT family transporter [Saccharothrix espanaensis]CCH33569.1 putative membrane protein [Saccharothrix espanaensis DSM 44229]
MRRWLPRGLWMGLLHGGVQVGTDAVAVHSPGAGSPIRYIALGLVVVAGLLWGALDAWRGLDGRGMVWFFAALVAGPVAGLVGVLGKSALVDQTGVEALGAALTGGAAFTALLVLATAAIGLGLGNALPQPGGSAR